MKNFRKCIVTRKIRNVNEMIRVAKLKGDIFVVNSNEKGRGAYISKDINDIETIKKNRLLNRAFKTDVPLETYDKLEQILKEG